MKYNFNFEDYKKFCKRFKFKENNYNVLKFFKDWCINE